MDVIKAIEDYSYYYSATGQDQDTWTMWRAEAVNKWGLDAAECEVSSIPRRRANHVADQWDTDAPPRNIQNLRNENLKGETAMEKTIEMIYDQIHGGILPASAQLEAFNTELEGIIRPLKKRADFEDLASICYDMVACAQRYGFTCGFKQGVGFMMECMA